MTVAVTQLDEKGTERLKGLLRPGDQHGDVATCWPAKEAVRESHVHADADVALEWVYAGKPHWDLLAPVNPR